MPNSLAERTIDRVTSAIKSGQVSTGSDLTRIITALGQDETAISIPELAKLIEQDSQILSRVITTANTLGYNPRGVRIDNAEQAVHVIGFKRIRSLALSLTLLEQAGRDNNPEVQRTMAALSLMSGVMAQAAARCGSLLDPDLAFVCGSLRNFGRLLLSAAAPDEFSAALVISSEDGEEEAMRRCFGISPLELGYELLRSARLPEVILHAVQAKPHAVPAELAWIDQQYIRLAQFSLELAEITMDRGLSAGAFAERSRRLIERHRKQLPQLEDALPEILESAETTLREYSRCAGIVRRLNPALDRLRCRRTGRDPVPPTGHTASGLPSDPRGEAFVIAATPLPPTEALDELAQLDDPEEAVPLMLGAIDHALKCHHLIYARREADTGKFSLTGGHSSLAPHLIGRSLIEPGRRDVLNLCQQRLENVYIRDATDLSIRSHLPPWLCTIDAPQSFVLLPVHHYRELIAFVIAGWDQPTDQNLDPETVRLLRLMIERVAALCAA